MYGNKKRTICNLIVGVKELITGIQFLKSELFTKQACRDAVVVYSLFFSSTTYIYKYIYDVVK